MHNPKLKILGCDRGDVFTWQNKQLKGSTHVRERMDRVVANGKWREISYGPGEKR
jgi:hypothetical protein